LLSSCSKETSEPGLTEPSAQVQLSPSVASIEDSDGTLNADIALSMLTSSGNPRITHSDNTSLGFQQNPFWFLLRINNSGPATERLLIAGRPHTDYIDLHVYNAQGDLIATDHQGDRLRWHERAMDDNEPVFSLSLPAEQTSFALLKVKTTGALELPITLVDHKGYTAYKLSRHLFSGLYFGAILAMCLFNLLLFIAIRDRSYLLYVLYLVALMTFLLTRSSIAFQLLWPETPWLNDTVRVSASLAGEGLAVLFAAAFLQLRHSRRRLNLLMQSLGCSLVVLAILSWFFEPEHTLRFATIAVIFIAPALLVPAVLRIRDGFKPAQYFLLAFTPIAALAPLFVLKTFALIESNWLLDHAFEIGSTLEAWLLSFALAYRLTMLKVENDRMQTEANIRLEQRVQERTEELNSALSARSEFLAVMSHEIRTPLNGMLGTLDMLKDSHMDAEQRRKVQLIEQSGNTLVELINDILDYSRIDAGKLPIDDEQFNLPGLIRESVALFEHRARINGNELIATLNDNLGLLCHGDPIRLRQILVNLVSNAVKFTEGGTVSIDVKRDPHNQAYVLFEVHDQGIGISRQQMSHLFELFQQGDGSTRRRYGGTGLGLAISRQLVELMGGEIGVESEPGRGSHFWFRLPLPEVSRDERRAQQKEEMDLDEHTPQVRLLIVDDNHVNLLVAQGLAKKLGHEVEVAETGPEALSVLLNDSRPFDLIFMDCEMPEMDGFETSREIIRLQNQGKIDHIPIIALTAHAVPDKIRLCHEAGMVSHIAKPINSRKLDRNIRSVLKSGNAGSTAPEPNQQ
jgi:signal transduction histidine kinase/CheY-like chemotaxis protein